MNLLVGNPVKGGYIYPLGSCEKQESCVRCVNIYSGHWTCYPIRLSLFPLFLQRKWPVKRILVVSNSWYCELLFWTWSFQKSYLCAFEARAANPISKTFLKTHLCRRVCHVRFNGLGEGVIGSACVLGTSTSKTCVIGKILRGSREIWPYINPRCQRFMLSSKRNFFESNFEAREREQSSRTWSVICHAG